MFLGGERLLLTSSLFKWLQWDGPLLTWDELSQSLHTMGTVPGPKSSFRELSQSDSLFLDIPQTFSFTLKGLLFKGLGILRQILRFTEVLYLKTFTV